MVRAAAANCSTRWDADDISVRDTARRNPARTPGSVTVEYGYCAERIVRAFSVSPPIATTRSSMDSNFSCPRIRATKSTATCCP